MEREDSKAVVVSSSAGGGAAASVKRNPSDFLKQVIGKPIIVQLNSVVTYKGILACLDGFMNIAMEQTEEYVDGQLKARFGDCFIRGNNGESSSLGLFTPLILPSSKKFTTNFLSQYFTSAQRKVGSKRSKARIMNDIVADYSQLFKYR